MRKSKVVSMTLYQEDIEILDRLVSNLSLNRSAIIRLALKTFESNSQVGRMSLGLPHD